MGNGLTDPISQTQTLVTSAAAWGLVSPASAAALAAKAAEVVQLIKSQEWDKAHTQREVSFVAEAELAGYQSSMPIWKKPAK